MKVAAIKTGDVPELYYACWVTKENYIYLANTFFSFSSIETVVSASLKIAHLDKGMLGRLFQGLWILIL